MAILPSPKGCQLLPPCRCTCFARSALCIGNYDFYAGGKHHHNVTNLCPKKENILLYYRSIFFSKRQSSSKKAKTMKERLALSDTPVYSFFFLGPFIVCVKLRREIKARICDTNLGLKTKIENWGSQFSAAGKKISGSADLKLCSFQRRDQTSRRGGLLLNLWKKMGK